MGEQEDTARLGWKGGRKDERPALDGVSVRVSVCDTGSVLPLIGGGTDGSVVSGETTDGRGSGAATDGGSRPDLRDPADREDKTEISPPIKSTLGLEGRYPLGLSVCPEENSASGVV